MKPIPRRRPRPRSREEIEQAKKAALKVWSDIVAAYQDRRTALTALAAHYRVPLPWLRERLVESGVKIRADALALRRALSPAQQAVLDNWPDVRAAYKTRTVKELSDELGVGPAWLRSRLIERGVLMRTLAETHRMLQDRRSGDVRPEELHTRDLARHQEPVHQEVQR
ncbi:hypothetical protein [Streptomyces luteireticuli]|uniref:Uncharacterized protein n=1 Tax=Streptomyces luteireticuli TaxID=173858 RepID=A0ABP3IJ02_9ACTN